MNYTITIGKNGKDWVVSKPDPPTPNPRMGDVIEWQFDKSYQDASVAAHLQFTSMGLFGNPRNAHETATVTPGSPLQLTVKEANDQKREKDPGKHGRHYHYAVWVVEANGTGAFAIGHNPPPEINIGP